jgi:arylformamidase
LATGVDYEVEYNNRARVPENPSIMAGWAKDAAVYRERHTPRVIAYGPGGRNSIDLFPGNDEGPVVVFIHGGYWQALDGSFFSHLAGGLNAHGIGVAIPGYDLCPAVTVDEIIRQMRMATRELARLGRSLVVSGHSAGGHLAACMLATDWQAFDASLPGDPVIAAYAISGLFDLGPLVGTSINKAMGLDDATARAASPLFWKAPARGSLDAVVGENESAEYFRQSRTIVEQWGAAGTATRFGVVAGANHFTAIAPLADPGSPMVARLMELARRQASGPIDGASLPGVGPMRLCMPRGGTSLEPGKAQQRQHPLQDSPDADEHDEQLEELCQSAVVGKFVDRPKTDGTEDDNNQNTNQCGKHPIPLHHR